MKLLLFLPLFLVACCPQVSKKGQPSFYLDHAMADTSISLGITNPKLLPIPPRGVARLERLHFVEEIRYESVEIIGNKITLKELTRCVLCNTQKHMKGERVYLSEL